MAKRFIETDLWKKKWFRKLPTNVKLFYFYILTNCDHAGMYDVDLELAEFQIGMDIDKDNILKHIGEHIEIIKDDKWFLRKFVDFQYGILKDTNNAHRSVIKQLDKYDIDLDLLERGQMLKVNIAKVDISREAKILRNYILRYTHKNPRKKFSVRSLSDGVGIWRIK